MEAQRPNGMSEQDYERMIAYDTKHRMEEEAKRVIAAHPVYNAYNTVIGVDLYDKPVIQEEYFEEMMVLCIKMMKHQFPEIIQRKKFIMKVITPPKPYYGDCC
jgi:hypothetical protein